MPLTDSLLPEFDHEMGSTRRLLDRVPDAELRWAPHPKSMRLGQLSTHLATIPEWVAAVLGRDAFDIDEPVERPAEPTSRDALLEVFDRNVAIARSAIAGKTDAELMAPWTLKKGGEEVFTLPKVGVLRSFLLNHMIHHRGQLSVYLRLKDVPIPSIYGPSADEGM